MLSYLRSRTAIVAHDLLMVPIAWFGAYWLRFNLDSIPEGYFHQALMLLPIVWATQGGMFWYFGLYRGVWRFASMPDLLRIFKAVVVSGALSALVVFFLTRLENVPRSVFILHGLLLLLLLGGPRFVYRWAKDRSLYHPSGGRVLIVGAGHAGEMLVRDLLRDIDHTYIPAAFVDDDPAKKGKELHGVRVFGGCEKISDVVKRQGIDTILIAVPSATSKQMRRIVGICESSGVPFRMLPRYKDLVTGRAAVKELREVSIEDLLGREPVSLDWQSINAGISGKTIMVSGGGGSIGSELCRQIAAIRPAELIIFDNSEYNLYAIDQELGRAHPDLAIRICLGDVCDPVAVDRAVAGYRPQLIFHAAAYKHVPMLETQIREAVLNNVIGTRIMAHAADSSGCEAFVLISTDKAVNPANVMGASKRVAEVLCQSLGRRSKTKYITVRFGNVLNSTGSVVPLFRKQIEAGGPVTVTHPEIRRYFMTIPEATQLILQASVIGAGNEIYVLDMGEPVKIAYLAEQLIILSGKKPGEDIEIEFTGLRPGEKVYEELFHHEEKLIDTGYPKILQAQPRQVDENLVETALDALVTACREGNEAEITENLYRLVPERIMEADNVPSSRNAPRTPVIYN